MLMSNYADYNNQKWLQNLLPFFCYGLLSIFFDVNRKIIKKLIVMSTDKILSFCVNRLVTKHLWLLGFNYFQITYIFIDFSELLKFI